MKLNFRNLIIAEIIILFLSTIYTFGYKYFYKIIPHCQNSKIMGGIAAIFITCFCILGLFVISVLIGLFLCVIFPDNLDEIMHIATWGLM